MMAITIMGTPVLWVMDGLMDRRIVVIGQGLDLTLAAHSSLMQVPIHTRLPSVQMDLTLTR